MIIGANAVDLKEMPDGVVVAGVAGRIIRAISDADMPFLHNEPATPEQAEASDGRTTIAVMALQTEGREHGFTREAPNGPDAGPTINPA